MLAGAATPPAAQSAPQGHRGPASIVEGIFGGEVEEVLPSTEARGLQQLRQILAERRAAVDASRPSTRTDTLPGGTTQVVSGAVLEVVATGAGSISLQGFGEQSSTGHGALRRLGEAWAAAWPVLEVSWRSAQDADLREPLLLGSPPPPAAQQQQQQGTAEQRRAPAAAPLPAMAGRMGADDSHDNIQLLDGSEELQLEGDLLEEAAGGAEGRGGEAAAGRLLRAACRCLVRRVDLPYKLSLAKGRQAVEAARKVYLMVRPQALVLCIRHALLQGDLPSSYPSPALLLPCRYCRTILLCGQALHPHKRHIAATFPRLTVPPPVVCNPLLDRASRLCILHACTTPACAKPRLSSQAGCQGQPRRKLPSS